MIRLRLVAGAVLALLLTMLSPLSPVPASAATAPTASSTAAATKATKTVRVFEFNMAGGKTPGCRAMVSGGSVPGCVKDLATEIKASGADVVMLAEVCKSHFTALTDDPDRAGDTALLPGWGGTFTPLTNNNADCNKEDKGQVLMSPHSMKAPDLNSSCKPRTGEATMSGADVGAKVCALGSLKTASNGTKLFRLTCADISDPGHFAALACGTHLISKAPLDTKRDQVATVARVANHPNRNVVVAGDFNTSKKYVREPIVDKGFQECDGSNTKTHIVNGKDDAKIDYIYFNFPNQKDRMPDWGTVDKSADRLKSDHYVLHGLVRFTSG